MTKLFKRGAIYHFDTSVGGRRLRGSLGTRIQDIARKRIVFLDYATQDGPKSEAWIPLRLVLPPKTVALLNRALLGPSPNFSLRQIEHAFCEKLDRQLAVGQIAESTVSGYEKCVGVFIDWLSQNVQQMDEVTTQVLEKYFLHRSEEIKQSPQATNGRGVLVDLSAVRKFLIFCAEEKFMAPVKLPEIRVKGEIQGAECFTEEELQKMEKASEGMNRLVFLAFRWTGLRASDLTSLTWEEIDLRSGNLRKVTQKRKKLVTVPLSPVLHLELQKWYDMVQPEKSDRVIPNATREKLYRMMVNLGKKSGVPNSNPHRFRDSLAIHLMEKGIPIYDAAQILGDSVSVTEAHYSRFTRPMQDRVRKVFEEVA